MVTASGFKDRLAVVTHASECLSSNDQVGSMFVVAIASEISRSTVVLFSTRVLEFFFWRRLSCWVSIII